MAPLLSRAALLLLTFGALPAFAQADAGVLPPLAIQARAKTGSVQLGEVFEVEIAVTHDKGQRYDLTPPSEAGDFEVLGSSRSRVDGADNATTTFTVQLSAFALGKLTTPPMTLDVATPAGASQFPVQGVAIEVVSSLPADAQTKGANLYDVRPPEAVPVRTWRVLYALLALLAAAGLAWAVWRYLKRPKPVALIPEKPKEPLHVRTLAALDALAKENLPGQGQFKAFYFRLSEILRAYLGELFDVDALESTTPELLEALRTRTTPGLAIKDLSDFAHASDFVRYAKQQPTVDDCKTSLELVYRIVHETTAARAPRPTAPESHGPR